MKGGFPTAAGGDDTSCYLLGQRHVLRRLDLGLHVHDGRHQLRGGGAAPVELRPLHDVEKGVPGHRVVHLEQLKVRGVGRGRGVHHHVRQRRAELAGRAANVLDGRELGEGAGDEVHRAGLGTGRQLDVGLPRRERRQHRGDAERHLRFPFELVQDVVLPLDADRVQTIVVDAQDVLLPLAVFHVLHDVVDPATRRRELEVGVGEEELGSLGTLRLRGHLGR